MITLDRVRLNSCYTMVKCLYRSLLLFLYLLHFNLLALLQLVFSLNYFIEFVELSHKKTTYAQLSLSLFLSLSTIFIQCSQVFQELAHCLTRGVNYISEVFLSPHYWHNLRIKMSSTILSSAFVCLSNDWQLQSELNQISWIFSQKTPCMAPGRSDF